jgi:hypothetical protein
MNPELAKKMLDVIAGQDEKAALALLIELAASMAAGGETPAEPAAESALAETPEVPPPAPGEEEKLAKLSKSVEGMAATIATLSATVKAYETAEATREGDERRELVAGLVKCGSETPASAWSGNPEDRKPAEPWASMPIAALRERVARLSKGAPVRPAVPAVTVLSAADEARAAKMTPEQKARFTELRASRGSA